MLKYRNIVRFFGGGRTLLLTLTAILLLAVPAAILTASGRPDGPTGPGAPPPAAAPDARPAAPARAAPPAPHGAAAQVASAGQRIIWQEKFQAAELDWTTPPNQTRQQAKQVFEIVHQAGQSYLHARHIATPGQAAAPPPAVHYGKAFRKPIPLEQVKALRWRWRVLKQPEIEADEPWSDLAASVYVVMKMPSALSSGRGFKFGWLARPGPSGGKQRGIIQVALRHDQTLGEWRSEEIDLCALYRKYFGPCEGAVLLYVGVVTDADDSQSVAEGDYADFELIGR